MIRIQHELSQTEHTHVTSALTKKQNVTSAPESPLRCPSSHPPSSNKSDQPPDL